MDIGALIKRYRAMLLVTMLLVLNSKMCLADHAVASELIISMAAKFETRAVHWGRPFKIIDYRYG